MKEALYAKPVTRPEMDAAQAAFAVLPSSGPSQSSTAALMPRAALPSHTAERPTSTVQSPSALCLSGLMAKGALLGGVTPGTGFTCALPVAIRAAREAAAFMVACFWGCR